MGLSRNAGSAIASTAWAHPVRFNRLLPGGRRRPWTATGETVV